MNNLAIISLIITILSSSAFAWRETGHYTVCEIGYQLSSTKTKKILDTIFEGNSFAVQCTWPDLVRKTKEYKYSYPMHFINLDDGEDYFESIDTKGDALQAILNYSDSLRADRHLLLSSSIKLGSKSRKIKESLKFLGHFVGDIHQPLHVGHSSDLGGNKIKVKWEKQDKKVYKDFKIVDGGHISVKTSEKPINLHKCIDQHIFEKFIKENKLEVDDTETAYKSYSSLLLKGKIENVLTPSLKNIKKWQSVTPEVWMQESIEQRDKIYNVKSKQELSGAYYNSIMDSIHVRVLQGGVRLAGLLDRIFDKKDVLNKDDIELREKIKEALKNNE
jgi:hypothetical protein